MILIRNQQQLIEQAIRIFLFIFILFIPMKTSIYPISFTLFVFSCGVYLFINHQFSFISTLFIEHKQLFTAFGLVILSMICSNILSPYTSFNSWRIVGHYLFRYFLLFILLMHLYHHHVISKRFLIIAILSSLSLQCFDGIFQAMTGFDFIKSDPGALNLPLGISGAVFHRNTFGFFMAMGSIITLILLFNFRLSWAMKSILFILNFFFLFNMLFSFSRSSWVFYSIVLVIFLTLKYKHSFQTFFIIILSITIILVLFFSISNTLTIRLMELISLNPSGRYDIWLDALSQIKDHLLFGHGLMTYAQLSKSGQWSIHNQLLEILFFTGLFGFVTFTYLLYRIFTRILQIRDITYFALFIGFLIILQFDHSAMKSIPILSTLSLFAFFIYSDVKITEELPDEIS